MKKFEMPETELKSINKTIRFPLGLIDEIEKSITGKNCTFSAFVIAAVKYALENKEKEE